MLLAVVARVDEHEVGLDADFAAHGYEETRHVLAVAKLSGERLTGALWHVCALAEAERAIRDVGDDVLVDALHALLLAEAIGAVGEDLGYGALDGVVALRAGGRELLVPIDDVLPVGNATEVEDGGHVGCRGRVLLIGDAGGVFEVPGVAPVAIYLPDRRLHLLTSHLVGEVVGLRREYLVARACDGIPGVEAVVLPEVAEEFATIDGALREADVDVVARGEFGEDDRVAVALRIDLGAIGLDDLRVEELHVAEVVLLEDVDAAVVEHLVHEHRARLADAVVVHDAAHVVGEDGDGVIGVIVGRPELRDHLGYARAVEEAVRATLIAQVAHRRTETEIVGAEFEGAVEGGESLVLALHEAEHVAAGLVETGHVGRLEQECVDLLHGLLVLLRANERLVNGLLVRRDIR